MDHKSTFQPRGTVYGVLLNFRREYAAWQHQMDSAPYLHPPKAPVLYIKPANTWAPSGMEIAIPYWVPEVEIGASIAMVMKNSLAVDSYVIVNDVSIPHESYFRPPTQYKSLDGFFGFSTAPISAEEVEYTENFQLDVYVNGARVQIIDFSDLIRPATELIKAVGEFMTLKSGDWLMLGLDIPAKSQNRPLVHIGDHIKISGADFMPLENTLVAQEAK